MKKDKVIPIKHGGKYMNVEAYANTVTGKVEEGSWDQGPSNTFHAGSGVKVALGNQRNYRENYQRIFGHD
jgi:hypothetical protein